MCEPWNRIVHPEGGESMNKLKNLQDVTHPDECASCVLHGSGACGSITALTSMAGGVPFVCHVFEPGAVLYRIGEPPDGLHFIVSGGVKLVSCDPAGNERIVRVAQDGGIMGFNAMTGERSAHSAVALDEVRTCRIPVDKLPRVLERRPALQLQLVRQMQCALSEGERWIAELASGVVPARVRLARLLLRLRLGEDDRIRRLQLTEVGSILGQTPETVCRTLKVFEQDQLLVPQGARGSQRYYHADIEALQRIAYEGADAVADAAPSMVTTVGTKAEAAPQPLRHRRGEAGLSRRAAATMSH